MDALRRVFSRRAGLHEKSPIARLREQKLPRKLFQDSICKCGRLILRVRARLRSFDEQLHAGEDRSRSLLDRATSQSAHFLPSSKQPERRSVGWDTGSDILQAL